MAKRNSEQTALTDQQLLFANEYLIDLNATQAAIRAGYSEKSAQMQGSRLLSNDKVASYLQELNNKRAKTLKVDAHTVLKELLQMSTVDITEAYTNEGWLKPLNEMPEAVRKCISGLEVNELFDGQGDDKHIIGVNKKIKFYDRTKALEMLGRHLKLFNDTIEANVSAEITVTIKDYLSKKDPNAS